MGSKRWQKIIGVLVVAIILLLACVPAAYALGWRSGENVVIDENEVIDDDMYIGASTFTLNGTIKGDLVVAGSDLIINGTVEGSVWAGGRSVTLNGVVKGSVRIAGAALTLGENAQIDGDLLAAGYSLEMKAGSKVARDIGYGGMQGLLAGDVTRNAWLSGNALDLRGSIGGNASIALSEDQGTEQFSPMMFVPNMPAVPAVKTGLTLSPGAKIGGNLEYVSSKDVPTTGVVAGQVKRTEPTTPEQVLDERRERERVSPLWAVVLWVWNQVRRLIALFLVGLLLVFVLPVWTKRLVDQIKAQPWPSLGWGFVLLIAVCVAFVVIAIVTVLLALFLGLLTLGGLSGTIVGIGILATVALAVVFSLAAGYVAQIVVSYLVGNLIFSRAKLSPVWEKLLSLFVGLLIFVLITAIPCAGALIEFVVVLFGLGAIWLLGRELLEKKPAA